MLSLNPELSHIPGLQLMRLEKNKYLKSTELIIDSILMENIHILKDLK